MKTEAHHVSNFADASGTAVHHARLWQPLLNFQDTRRHLRAPVLIHFVTANGLSSGCKLKEEEEDHI